jgi:hypothetical protein
VQSRRILGQVADNLRRGCRIEAVVPLQRELTIWNFAAEDRNGSLEPLFAAEVCPPAVGLSKQKGRASLRGLEAKIRSFSFR